MSLQQYYRSYRYDDGLNLLHQGFGNAQRKRMVVSRQSNRAIGDLLYHRLDLTPPEKANPEQTFRDKGIFDTHGNQLKTGTLDALTWDYRNRLQTTTQVRADGTKTVEYNVYAAPGRRSKKVTKTIDKYGNISEIEEAIYLNDLEYCTTWMGNDLHYDGETVTEVDNQGNRQTIPPDESSRTLRIRDGRKQIARIKTDTASQSTQTHYYLDNHINSCQMVMDSQGNLQSYLAFYPYGNTAVSFGQTSDQAYNYSGKEQDKSGLYYYGYRSYLPDNFRWMSPDPLGLGGGGTNLFVYVNNNPTSFTDYDGRYIVAKDHRVFEMLSKSFQDGIIPLSPISRDKQKKNRIIVDQNGLSMWNMMGGSQNKKLQQWLGLFTELVNSPYQIDISLADFNDEDVFGKTSLAWKRPVSAESNQLRGFFVELNKKNKQLMNNPQDAAGTIRHELVHHVHNMIVANEKVKEAFAINKPNLLQIAAATMTNDISTSLALINDPGNKKEYNNRVHVAGTYAAFESFVSVAQNQSVETPSPIAFKYYTSNNPYKTAMENKNGKKIHESDVKNFEMLKQRASQFQYQANVLNQQQQHQNHLSPTQLIDDLLDFLEKL